MLKNLETLALNENNLTDLPGTFLIIHFGKHFVDSYDSNKIFYWTGTRTKRSNSPLVVLPRGEEEWDVHIYSVLFVVVRGFR